MPLSLRLWTVATLLLTVLVLGLSGRWHDPWLWTYLAAGQRCCSTVCSRSTPIWRRSASPRRTAAPTPPPYDSSA